MDKEKSIINSKLDELNFILGETNEAVSFMQSKVLSVMTDKMEVIKEKNVGSNTPRAIQSDISERLDGFILRALDIRERIKDITKNIEL